MFTYVKLAVKLLLNNIHKSLIFRNIPFIYLTLVLELKAL